MGAGIDPVPIVETNNKFLRLLTEYCGCLFDEGDIGICLGGRGSHGGMIPLVSFPRIEFFSQIWMKSKNLTPES